MLDARKNFAKSTLASGIAAGATSATVATGEGAKFPQPSTDGEFNAVIWDKGVYPDPTDDPDVEVVRVTARTTDTLTIARAQEGTSDVNHNTGGHTYGIMLPVTEKMISDIDTALSNRFSKQAAAEISALTNKTTPVDADVFLGEDSAAGTAFSKIKVTWANIKATLKAYFDTLYTIGSKSLVLGETIASANTAVFVEDSTTLFDVSTLTIDSAGTTQYAVGDSSARTKISQSITGDGKTYGRMSFVGRKYNSPSGEIIFEIQTDSGGNPSGTVLATAQKASADMTTTFDPYTISFDTPVQLNNGTTYHLVIRSSIGVAGQYYILYGTTSSTYAGGNYEVYNGSSWSDDTNVDLRLAIIETSMMGRVYKTAANVTGKWEGAIGFSPAGSKGDSKAISFVGVISGFTGLSVGQKYYLSDTAGTISTTPGSNSRVVGIAISSTEMLKADV